MTYSLPPLPTCETPGCTGHLGKFDNCETEALYMMTLDGSDRSTGDAIDWNAYYSLVILESPESIDLPDGPTVTVPAGDYIVECMSSGAVYSWVPADTESEWASLEAAYAEFLGDDEDEPTDDDEPHTGHYSRIGGTWWCDTCNSPYCDLA